MEGINLFNMALQIAMGADTDVPEETIRAVIEESAATVDETREYLNQ